ncbi:MATE family efflux transporter [Flavobacterium sp. AG291]|uniref:MATE family efflux transporter n=1 Tax=Flavobacterium sp. AG291 TaxID=2184000 RepID=UPI000E0BA550|nr:MATE family efflux transporter [Flavobacterium sp. AG291]RDI05337.1 putative MATE family efflux protein [Flavobacterium sp. AG291]
MTQDIQHTSALSRFFALLKQSLKGENIDFTQGSIRRAVILLAIPMMLEMAMESVFALVDLYFVGHLENSSFAVQTVGLTESVLSVVYSIAIGMSMAATAVVARRIGEKDPVSASKAGMQAIIIAVAVNVVLAIFGLIYATDILILMGSSEESAIFGTPFMRIMMGGSFIIMLLFLFNGIFRGAGNAAIAMRSLWIANLCNIILCTILVPNMGLTGAAIATTIGRSIGVLYQLYNLFNGKGILKVAASYFLPDWEQIKSLVKIAAPGVLQFVIASCSWIFLAELVATTGGDEGSAGYQSAIRIMMFFMLPAWGMSGAAATLVGQNLGAKLVDRAERSVFVTAKFSVSYMAIIMVICLLAADPMMWFFTNNAQVHDIAVEAIRILSAGYIFYGIGMVLLNAFNGAGDTKTPTWVNFFGFWIIQIPLAYVLAKHFNWGPTGVFWAIPIAETFMTIISFILFRRGKWKKVEV